LAQPDRRVLVVTGDGEILMGLGALATIGVQRPQNLAIAVFDNSRYGETGMQASHTDAAVSLPAVACACGIEQAFDVTNEPALRAFSTLMHSARAMLFARVAIIADGTPRVLPPRDGALLKTRFSPRHWC
jgi:thiamine pyrophosphate-dependent acetolactate synthase large subunit-like protein